MLWSSNQPCKAPGKVSLPVCTLEGYQQLRLLSSSLEEIIHLRSSRLQVFIIDFELWLKRWNIALPQLSQATLGQAGNIFLPLFPDKNLINL